MFVVRACADALQRQLEAGEPARQSHEELLSAACKENEMLRRATAEHEALAAAAQDRLAQAEQRADHLQKEVEAMLHERGELMARCNRERRRAEASEARECQLRERNNVERARLCDEVEQGWKARRGLEAQVGALRNERRNQIVGYCGTMIAPSNATPLPKRARLSPPLRPGP